MFYLLKCNYKKKRSLFSRLFSSGVTVTGHRLCSVNFCIAEVGAANGIDWHKIANVIGRDEKLVLPSGVKIPDSVPLKSYPTDNTVGKLIAEGALAVIAEASKQNHTFSVMLIDKGGKYTYLLTPLMKYAQTVTAVTASKEQYDHSAKCLLDTLGASPVITDNTQTTAVCNVIIAPDGISGCGTLPLPAMIFAPNGCDFITVGSDNINMGSFVLDDEYDRLQLTAAINDSKDFDGTLPYAESMRVRDKNVPISELAQMLI